MSLLFLCVALTSALIVSYKLYYKCRDEGYRQLDSTVSIKLSHLGYTVWLFLFFFILSGRGHNPGSIMIKSFNIGKELRANTVALIWTYYLLVLNTALTAHLTLILSEKTTCDTLTSLTVLSDEVWVRIPKSSKSPEELKWPIKFGILLSSLKNLTSFRREGVQRCGMDE